jgi:hypothetical protein
MRWQTLQTQLQLDTLAALVRWEDSSIVEARVGAGDPPWLELLVRTAGSPFPYLQIALVDCDRAVAQLGRFSLRGKVAPAGTVELLTPDGSPLVCARRMHFRWLETLPPDPLDELPP